MPTYMLEGTTPVKLPLRPLTIALQLGGGVQGRLVALVDGEPMSGAVRPRPELLILPNVTGRVLLRIEPTGTEVFAQGSRANVSVTANDPGAADPERAVLPPVDLAGLRGQDAISIERGTDGLVVRSEVRKVVQVTLGRLADAARVVATELLGTQRLDGDDAIDTAIAIDASASFRRAVERGQVRRVLDLIDGVASVIDLDRVADTTILAATPIPVVAPANGTLADGVVSAFAELVPESGAPLASGEASELARIVERVAPGRAVTYVVTDAVPADRPAFERLHAADGRALHLVVIGHGSAFRLQRAPETPVTYVDVDGLPPAVAEGADGGDDPLVTAVPVLRQLVTALLEGVRQ